ncbi:MAG: CorA family divalent cation transporter [Alphaproteobacteria bacterium]
MAVQENPAYGVAPGLRFAYVLERNGRIFRNWSELRAWRPQGGPVWVHLERDHHVADAWLRSESGLDPLVTEALLAEESRPRVEAVDEGLLIVLRGISRIVGEAESALGGDADLVPVHMWVDGHRVITLRDQDHFLPALRDIRNTSLQGKGPARTGELLAIIAGSVIRDIEPVLDAMDNEMDALEDLILELMDAPHDHTPDKALRHRISQLRRRAIHLRRYLTPQRDALNRLQGEECAWLTPRDRLLIREDTDRLVRFIEYLDAIRDRAVILHDDLSGLVSERIARNAIRMSKMSNRLTAIAALLLPPSVIAGLLGMNVGGIPMSQDPHGFSEISAIAISSSVVILVGLRLLKWL